MKKSDLISEQKKEKARAYAKSYYKNMTEAQKEKKKAYDIKYRANLTEEKKEKQREVKRAWAANSPDKIQKYRQTQKQRRNELKKRSADNE